MFENYLPLRRIYYSNENGLLKRIALRCFLKGYLVLQFPKRNITLDKNIKKDGLKVFEKIEKEIIKYQKAILGTSYTKNNKNFFIEK